MVENQFEYYALIYSHTFYPTYFKMKHHAFKNKIDSGRTISHSPLANHDSLILVFENFLLPIDLIISKIIADVAIVTLRKHDDTTPRRGGNLKNYQMIHTSLRTESSNISLVILYKLIYYF